MLVSGQWLSSIIAIMFGVCLPYCALVVGNDFADLLLHLFERCTMFFGYNHNQGEDSLQTQPAEQQDPPAYGPCTAVFTITAFVTFFIATIVGAVVHKGDDTRRTDWTSGAFAPLGATSRWLLSRLNRCRAGFPLGTFLANVSALLLDVSVGAAILHGIPSSATLRILNALITGLGGSLSTVSTWISESVTLQRSQRYIYIITTTTFAILIGVVIYGPAYWADNARS